MKKLKKIIIWIVLQIVIIVIAGLIKDTTGYDTDFLSGYVCATVTIVTFDLFK